MIEVEEVVNNNGDGSSGSAEGHEEDLSDLMAKIADQMRSFAVLPIQPGVAMGFTFDDVDGNVVYFSATMTRLNRGSGLAGESVKHLGDIVLAACTAEEKEQALILRRQVAEFQKRAALAQQEAAEQAAAQEAAEHAGELKRGN